MRTQVAQHLQRQLNSAEYGQTYQRCFDCFRARQKVRDDTALYVTLSYVVQSLCQRVSGMSDIG